MTSAFDVAQLVVGDDLDGPTDDELHALECGVDPVSITLAYWQAAQARAAVESDPCPERLADWAEALLDATDLADLGRSVEPAQALSVARRLPFEGVAA